MAKPIQHPLFALELGDRARFTPEKGETVKAARARLWRLGRKYGRYDRFFRFEIVGQTVVAERVEEGLHKPLGEWWAMRQDDLRLIAKNYTADDYRLASKTVANLRKRHCEFFALWPMKDGRYTERGPDLYAVRLGPGRELKPEHCVGRCRQLGFQKISENA